MTTVSTGISTPEMLHGHVDHALEARAAGDGHDGHRQGVQIVQTDELGQLLHVVPGVVELGTGDDELVILQQFGMEATQAEGRAVGGDQKVGVLEVGGVGSYQVQLDGPLREFRAGRRGRFTGAGVDGGHRLFASGLAHVLAGGLDVVLRRCPVR